MWMGGRCQHALFDLLEDEQEAHMRKSGIKDPGMAVGMGMSYRVELGLESGWLHSSLV